MPQNFGINLSAESILIISIVVIGYIILISFFGGYLSSFSKNINDFFYSGQRFAWWIPTVSMVATGIGSYSYLKYSEQGFNTGMSSAITYMNDWFIIPFFMFGWLPIIYFSRIKSIPEYFERRFNRTARYISVIIILSYMFFYIGYNLYTIGIALEGMLGIPLKYTVPIIAFFLGSYVTLGGQTAVIFTDLFQGIMLYLAGGIAIFAGIYALGGLDDFWHFLPPSHRSPFPHFSENSKFNTIGLFWGDALAGSIAFSFMNQGFIMRYLTIKSINETKKAIFFNVLITLPLSAIIVGCVGWVAKALIMKQEILGGALPGYNLIEIQNTFHTFIIVAWETLKQNSWLFGFVMAALTAALMSTIDTLINACAAIGIYDIYKPIFRPNAKEKEYLLAARIASIIATIIGLLLVIWFNQQKGSLMSIHYKGIMIIIPSIVTSIFLGMLWPKFNSLAACISMILGSFLTLITVWFPTLIDPLAWFVGSEQNQQYIYMRALFGMSITAIIGIAVTFITSSNNSLTKNINTEANKTKTKDKKTKDIRGLTTDTLIYAIKKYKQGEPSFSTGEKASNINWKIDNNLNLDEISISPKIKNQLNANIGDLLYIEDNRWWLGGLRSRHVKLKNIHNKDDQTLFLSQETKELAFFLDKKRIKIEKII